MWKEINRFSLSLSLVSGAAGCCECCSCCCCSCCCCLDGTGLEWSHLKWCILLQLRSSSSKSESEVVVTVVHDPCFMWFSLKKSGSISFCINDMAVL
ncbi:hypothetical protein BC940DRAFT_289985 [Gongronella butleri]|nr:hypothetical protein BC940DRAFT_289985 [Gongronella butleri]